MLAKIAALCGGEALPFELAVSLRKNVSRLLNVYGPTETTIWSTFFEIPANVAETGIPGCIGTPIDNTTVYVVDRFGQPCPPGVAGELVIGGLGVVGLFGGRFRGFSLVFVVFLGFCFGVLG